MGAPILAGALWMACALSLSGCGASLDQPIDNALTPMGQKTAAATTNVDDAESSASANSAQTGDKSKTTATTPNLTNFADGSSTGATPGNIAQAALGNGGDTPEATATTGKLTFNVDKFTAAATPGNNGYQIGPLDVLEVSVFKVPELSRSVQVSDIGTINLPLVGDFPVSGKTAREVEHDLTAKLGDKYLQSPQVTVYVKQFNSQRVTIEGAVRKPGVYPVEGKTSLLQVVAVAQGLTDDADDLVVVFRNVNGKRVAGKFDINNIRVGQARDPTIQQGDVIVVSHSAMKAAWQNFLTGLGVAGKATIFF